MEFIKDVLPGLRTRSVERLHAYHGASVKVRGDLGQVGCLFRAASRLLEHVSAGGFLQKASARYQIGSSVVIGMKLKLRASQRRVDKAKLFLTEALTVQKASVDEFYQRHGII
ncbi:hypothetical protein CH063_14441 [Colletotrichum higginsianum]|uniref:Uncharacterized protein n=1 Tax=Colletotrichum higginsianum (strain IMI 349063) TaxID=759273 RepID=H1VYK6_COLHI|nr:hypothetical protein CH063_14441 [Colletotrichum higginsianum]